ncbi:prepilin-type N-terminal cleavage/methylation domain-containing protein [Candidatus Saccharibacteria bacterium]|nr:prepilin-type N-terminal cleavage/methylation domain-containing protein [Candidatus Saccharibacteria bacterium]
MRYKGFTILELLVVIVLLGVGSWLFFSEKSRVDAIQRDVARKTSINAMYYALEEVFYEKNSYYPSAIDSKTLRSVDPALFADPWGVKLGESLSNYRYEGKDCSTDGRCGGYELQSSMEREEDFIKTHRNK